MGTAHFVQSFHSLIVLIATVLAAKFVVPGIVAEKGTKRILLPVGSAGSFRAPRLIDHGRIEISNETVDDEDIVIANESIWVIATGIEK
jgi:hypothetical protein